jgi:hypothetical protein
VTPPELIAGPYTPPRVRRGQRVTCLYRDADCVVTAIHDAPIPWPRCRRPGSGGGSGLWVNDDLARAIKTESAVALKHWLGVGTRAVWNWRRAFGVKQWGTEGSRRLHRRTCAKGAAGIKAKDWTDEESDAISARAVRLGLARHLGDRWPGKHWTAKHLALLGKLPDDVVARRTGRTEGAVRVRRNKLRIPTARDRRRRENRGSPRA